MRLLLDTNALIYSLGSPKKLSLKVRDALTSEDSVVLVSAVSIWEMRIKQALGKLKVTSALLEAIQEQGFDLLPITPVHADSLKDLPMHHRDPFDRLLVAQALLEKLTVVTTDAVFSKYGVQVIQ
jgi:PIN domain nuclease of toxin-antitoxin system